MPENEATPFLRDVHPEAFEKKHLPLGEFVSEGREDLGLSQEDAEREASRVLMRIQQLPDGSSAVERGAEQGIEQKGGKLEKVKKALDDLFEIAVRQSPSNLSVGANLRRVPGEAKDFFRKMKAIWDLKMAQSDLDEAFADPEGRTEAFKLVERMLSDMHNTEKIKIHFSHNANLAKKLSNFGTDAVLRNQDVFLESLGANPDAQTEALVVGVMADVVGAQDTSWVKRGRVGRELVALATKFLPLAQRRIATLEKDPSGSNGLFGDYATVLNPLLLSRETGDLVQDVWSEAVLAEKNQDLVRKILEGHIGPWGKSNRPESQALSFLLERMGLEQEKFFDADRVSDKSKKLEQFRKRENYLKSILAAQALEVALPGSVARLSRDYGIQTFARYPKELLLRQLENEEDGETPYGVVLYPREDWNGGFYQSTRPLGQLGGDAEHEGVNVRIFECESILDATKKLIRLNQKYGAKQKVRFAVVGGHGNRETLQFGQRKGQAIQSSKIDGSVMKELRTFFDNQATIVLDSCSTGGDCGLAEALSQLQDVKVVAPDINAGLCTLTLSREGDWFNLLATYRSEEKIIKPRTYISGQLQSK